MEITIKDKKFTPWEEIKIGDIFRSWRGVFIKIGETVMGDCINLQTGALWSWRNGRPSNQYELASKITIEFGE